MTAHHPSKTIPFALGLAAVLASAPAFAEPSPEDKSLARDLGTEGVKLADAGDCVGAIEKLEKAEALTTRRPSSAGSASVRSRSASS